MAFTGKATHSSPIDGTAIEDVSDIIGIISPFETPLLDHLGDASKPTTNKGRHHYRWDNAMGDGQASNEVQLFRATIEVTGSAVASRAYGISDEVDYQKQERMRELLRDLENCVINGVAQPKPSMCSATMRGIISTLHTNVVDAEGAELDAKLLDDMISHIHRQSGTAPSIVVGGAQKRRINAFNGTLSLYESRAGKSHVVLSRWVPNDTVLLIDPAKINVVPLEGHSFTYHNLPTPKDETILGEVSGVYTLEIINENAHGIIKGLSV